MVAIFKVIALVISGTVVTISQRPYNRPSDSNEAIDVDSCKENAAGGLTEYEEEVMHSHHALSRRCVRDGVDLNTLLLSMSPIRIVLT